MEQQLLSYKNEMYRLDHAEHIARRLDRVVPRILCTIRNLMTWPPEQIRLYLRRARFEYVAYMVEFEHDWSLDSALIERWRPEFHTFHLPCGEMNITLRDVAYQLELRIDGDPVSGCIGGWEQHHQGWTIEELCKQIMGVVLGPEDRQSQTKWTVKLTWFQNTVCGELEQDVTEERLMRYTRGYIMQLIGVSSSQMHRLPIYHHIDLRLSLPYMTWYLQWAHTDHTFSPSDAIVPYLAEAEFGDTTWAMVEQLLGARPPVAAQQAAQRKESFTLKLVWLCDRVCQMPPTDNLETL
ncbi:hypothetical protein Ahy_A09g046577 [Arachis hypogaea]|uniref:Aminotransferase-like plant mobile domain-containing protein n=1 Tax=Arachis hypogaea TaxID=3818 RepID=A0A445BQ66_ARAHY|nr:hypothetical protein Ahy_A09g046577 [Arachis hypogaea]